MTKTFIQFPLPCMQGNRVLLDLASSYFYTQVLVINDVPFVLKNPKDLSNGLNFLDAMKTTAKQVIFSTVRRYNLKLCVSVLSQVAPLL